MAFLLAKMGVTVTRDIRLGEALRAVTRPCAPRRACYNRYTDFFDETGAAVARVDARWILVDIHSHRILRTPPEGACLSLCRMDRLGAGSHSFSPGRAGKGGRRRCGLFRVDINQHLNNTYYGDILCDALPTEVWRSEQGFRRAVLIYRQELPFGCEMELLRGRQPDGGWYVEGVHEGKRCFEGKILF